MVSRNIVFWEVDTQKDFMLPGGNLYVPGAEQLLPNIKSSPMPPARAVCFWFLTAAIT